MNPQTNSEKWFRFAMMYAKAASHPRFSSLEDGLQRMGKWASPSGFPSFEKASQEEVYQALDTIQGILRVLQDQEQNQGPSLTM